MYHNQKEEKRRECQRRGRIYYTAIRKNQGEETSWRTDREQNRVEWLIKEVGTTTSDKEQVCIVVH